MQKLFFRHKALAAPSIDKTEQQVQIQVILLKYVSKSRQIALPIERSDFLRYSYSLYNSSNLSLKEYSPSQSAPTILVLKTRVDL